jgi:ribosome-binding factor A
MNLRSRPQLHFEYDASLETGARLESLINKAIASDNKDEND